MRYPVVFVALVAVQGCSRTPISKADKLFDDIERQVRLPENARDLANYARYYAPGRGGKVLGVYSLPFPDLPVGPDQGCAEITGDDELKDVPCPPAPAEAEALKAGQRRWVSNEDNLPSIMDGGCNVINILFDIRTRKVEEVSCNGA